MIQILQRITSCKFCFTAYNVRNRSGTLIEKDHHYQQDKCPKLVTIGQSFDLKLIALIAAPLSSVGK